MLFDLKWTTVDNLSLVELEKLSTFVHIGLITLYSHWSVTVPSLEGIDATRIAVFGEEMRSDHEIIGNEI